MSSIMGSRLHYLVSIAALCSSFVLVQSNPVETSFVPRQATKGFTCSYPGYTTCNSQNDRGCWVAKGSKNYSIDTDYEDDFPVGITRTVGSKIDMFVVFHYLQLESLIRRSSI